MLERRFLDHLQVGAYRLDDAGEILEANDGAARVVGLASARAAIGRDMRDFIGESANVERFFAALRKSGSVRSYRAPLRHLDGHTIWVEHHAVMREDGGRSVIDGIFLDCTAMVEAEESIERAYASLDSLLKNTPGVAIQIYDASGVIQLWNPASEQLYGYPAADVAGHRIQELMPAQFSARFEQTLQRVISTGTPTAPSLWAVNHRDGGAKYVWSTMFPLQFGETGALVGCMDVDVTTDQETRERLEVSRRQLADSERVAHVGSWEWDCAGDQVWWSEELCRIWGVPYAPGPSRVLDDFLGSVHPDDRDEVSARVASALETGEAYVVEHRIVRPDGSTRDVLSRGEVITEKGQAVKLFGTVQDVTLARRSEELLRRKQAHLKVMVEQMPAIVWTTDRSLTFTSCRGRALQAVGVGDDELAGRSVGEFFFCRDEAVKAHEQALQGRSSVFLEHREGLWLQSHVEPFRDSFGTVIGCIGVAQDVTEQRAAEEQVAYLAYHDALTGLPNRMLLNDRLTLAIAHSERRESEAAVLFLDLDHFKLINDTLGHGTGDRLLQQIAVRVRASLRNEETLARVGGDEFVILLPQVDSPDDAARVASHLLQVISAPFLFDHHTLYATASSGIAVYPRDGRSAEDLLRSADSAMYKAKELGRNNYQFCTPELTAHALERLSIENGIRRALEENRFVVYYQPVVDIDTRAVLAAEALVRWDDPRRGLVGPGTFIPVAEDSRLILPLGEWVIADACRQLSEWRRSGVPIARIAINLSPHQLHHGDIVDRIEQIVSSAGVQASDLDLEITETSAMHNMDTAVPQLLRLAKMGAGIVIDDFGVGYSSLNYLKRLPITGLKIDRSFIADFPSRSSSAIVQAIIATARALDLRVTAEGVETEEQAEFLRSAGCPQAQGFLFARPMPAAELESFLRSL